MNKSIMTLFAAAGVAALFAMPAKAATANGQTGGLHGQSSAENTEISSQRRWNNRRAYNRRAWRGGRNYGYRRGYYGPRYGYYRPYGYRNYGYYGPGVSLGFGGGPRFGVWF